MKSRVFAVLASLIVLLGGTGRVAAQWQTQSILVKPGWTAVYLFVDASYTNLDSLVGNDPNNPIEEVWLWQPAVNSVQYVTSAQAPITGSSQWANWERLNNGLGTGSTLSSLAPNAAYLIHSGASTNYTWNVTGLATVPNYSWSSTSINLIGFPTVANNPPALDSFLSLVPAFQSVATIYQYNGGNLSASNPGLVLAPHTVDVNRGQAFWINSPSFGNTYFGPFQVVVGGGATAFGASSGSTTFRLINTTLSPVTVNLTLQPSVTPPAGQASIAGVPPLIVRGALDPSSMTYGVSSLSASTPLSWTLAPQGQGGSDIAVILGVNRTALPNNPGALYAGILQFTDSDNFTEVDVPASAQAGSYAGLWLGQATLSQVSSYLKTFQRDVNGNPVQSTNGAYVVTSVNTNLGAVASSAAFPMRLILHNDGNNVNLLQRVFYGSDINSNTIVATSESALDPARLGSARRISAIQFPWTPTNQTWALAGQLVPGATLTTTVTVNYDDQASNPFLHTYHPDHDNLDPSFQSQLPIGAESYQIDRQITLSLSPPGNDFNSLIQFGQTFSGAYAETITLTGYSTRTFNVAGGFAITRLSPIAVLTRPQ